MVRSFQNVLLTVHFSELLGPKNSIFSEFAFLNKNRKDPQNIPSARSSSPCSQSEHSSASRPPRKILITNRDTPKSKRSVKLPVSRRDPHSVHVRASQDRLGVAEKSKDADAESELWDIELEDSQSIPGTKIFPAVVNHSGMVVMNTMAIWPDVHAARDKELEDEDTGRSYNYLRSAHPSSCCGTRGIGHNHSSSLCPSESASQCGQPPIVRPHTHDAASHQATSKYFPATRAQIMSTTAEEASLPAHQVLQKVSARVRSAAPLVYPNDAPLIADDHSHPTAVANNYHNPKMLVACSSAVDSIEMELRAYMDNIDTEGIRQTSNKDKNEIFGASNDCGNCESYVDDQQLYFGDSQDGMSELEMKNDYAHYDQHMASMLDEYGGMNAEQGTVSDYIPCDDMSGFIPYEFATDDDTGIGDFEYGPLQDPFDESVQYDSTVSPGVEYSPCQGTVAVFDDNTGDEGQVLLTERFSQGRAILLGLSDLGNHPQESVKPIGTVLHAEADVARSLTEHWLPQRF